MTKHSIDFSAFGEIGRLPRVRWTLHKKTATIDAWIDGWHDRILIAAIDKEALDAFVMTMFWQQGPEFPKAEMVHGGNSGHHGNNLDAAIVPVLARGITLHYIVGLQRMAAAMPDDPVGLEAACQWEKGVEYLRDNPPGHAHNAIFLASCALEIVEGRRRDGERTRKGVLYELVPEVYREALYKRSESDG